MLKSIQRIKQLMFYRDIFCQILLNTIVHKDYCSCNLYKALHSEEANVTKHILVNTVVKVYPLFCSLCNQ